MAITLMAFALHFLDQMVPLNYTFLKQDITVNITSCPFYNTTQIYHSNSTVASLTRRLEQLFGFVSLLAEISSRTYFWDKISTNLKVISQPIPTSLWLATTTTALYNNFIEANSATGCSVRLLAS